jgi:hypothetical protein
MYHEIFKLANRAFLAQYTIMLTPAQLKEFAELYVGNGAAQNPLISSLHADLAGLPPMWM